MDCRDKILSNNFYDIITDYPLRLLDTADYDLCYTEVSDGFHVLYINSVGLPKLLDNLYDYRNIPKLYGLMQDTGAAPGFNPINCQRHYPGAERASESDGQRRDLMLY